MRYALALCLALLTSPAFAWTDGGSPLNLRIPALTDSGSSWTESLRYNFGKISTAAALGTSVSTATVIYNPLGNLALTYGLTASTFTATEYSSAPVMHVSTFAASGDFNFYTDDGDHALHIGAGTTSGLRVNQGTWAGGQSWNIELFNTSEPTFAFRRNKTSISDGQTLGGLYWRDHDTSTGGSGVKAYMKVNPRGNWGSNDPMETEFNWGLSRSGGTASDYMVLTSSGLNVSGAGSFSGGVTVGSMTSLGAMRVVGELNGGAATTSGLFQIGAGPAGFDGARMNMCGSASASCGGTGALQYFTKGNATADHIWYTDQGGGAVENMRLTGGNLQLVNATPILSFTAEEAHVTSLGGFNFNLDNDSDSTDAFRVKNNGGSAVVFSVDEAGAGSFSGSVTVGSMTSLGNIGIPNSAAIDFTDTIGTPRSMIGMGSTQVLKINYGGSWNTSINESGGSVGIGTASPATTLDVNGIITSSGTAFNKQNIIMADTGDASTSNLTFTPAMGRQRLFCQDADGCVFTFGETGVVNGTVVHIINVQAAANTTLTYGSGVAQLAGTVDWTTFNAFDVITLIYDEDRWIEVSRSVN